jgi:hypothetical protein
MMGTDAIIGKATRKARAWLWQHITGQEIPDGDASEIIYVTPSDAPRKTADALKEKIKEKLGKKAEVDPETGETIPLDFATDKPSHTEAKANGYQPQN